MFRKIPTYDDSKKEWSYTFFKTQELFLEFLWSLYKEPGKYDFDETSSRMFNEQGQYYNKHGIFNASPSGTVDYIDYWDREKEKNRLGVIIKNKKTTHHTPRY